MGSAVKLYKGVNKCNVISINWSYIAKAWY